MDVVLHAISTGTEDGLDLLVSFGRAPPRRHRAWIERDEPNGYVLSFDEALFFALSEYSVRRYADATLYQVEVADMARAFAHDGSVPLLPVRLGTTGLVRRPTFARMLRGHCRRFVWRFRRD